MRALPPRKVDARTTNRRQYQDEAPAIIVFHAPQNGCNGFVTDDLYSSIVARRPLRHSYAEALFGCHLLVFVREGESIGRVSKHVQATLKISKNAPQRLQAY